MASDHVSCLPFLPVDSQCDVVGRWDASPWLVSGTRTLQFLDLLHLPSLCLGSLYAMEALWVLGASRE